MVNRYFDKFPTVSYNGFNITDITKSALLVNKYVNAPYVYNQYNLDKEQRADTVASDFYNDPYMTWMIYYANKIIDPYYDWYLNEDDFNKYIDMKYGSIDIASRTIKQFIVNWFSDNTELSPSEYLNRYGTYKGTDSNYWNPIYDENSGVLLYYVRKRSNLQVNTNQLVKVAVANSAGYAAGDLIKIYQFTNGVPVGQAEVEWASNNYIILKNVIQNIANSYYLYKDNGANTQITNYSAVENFTQNVWTSQNISAKELVYWIPLYAYDLERELNNYKKTVKLVDPSLAVSIANILKDDLNE